MKCKRYLQTIRKILEPDVEIKDFSIGSSRFTLTLTAVRYKTPAEKLDCEFRLQDEADMGVKVVVEWKEEKSGK